MTRLYILISLLIATTLGNAQQLVPNGDFESNSGCPTPFSPISLSTGWMNPSLVGSPDYYHSCAAGTVGVPNNIYGYQAAHSGMAYSGLYLTQITDDVREFLEIQLMEPLLMDSCYKFQMFVNLGDYCYFTTDAIGIYFSDTAITDINNWYPLPFTPHISNPASNYFDNVNWKKVGGNYKAHGGERYIIIGNYKNDANTSLAIANTASQLTPVYCYIDDVSLTKLKSCKKRPSGAQSSLSEEETPYLIYPNPVVDRLNVSRLDDDSESGEFILYDMNNKIVLRTEFEENASLNTSGLSTGMYFYEIRSNSTVVDKGRIVK